MRKKLLLADDSITIQKVVELTFPRDEFEVTTVGNGRLAVERAATFVPDIVLCDVVMPQMDGYQAAEGIRAIPGLERVPILLLNGAFEPFDEARGRAVGALGNVSKPFEPPALVARVRTILSQQAALAAPPVPPPTVPVPMAEPEPDVAAVPLETEGAFEVEGTQPIGVVEGGEPVNATDSDDVGAATQAFSRSDVEAVAHDAEPEPMEVAEVLDSVDEESLTPPASLAAAAAIAEGYGSVAENGFEGDPIDSTVPFVESPHELATDTLPDPGEQGDVGVTDEAGVAATTVEVDEGARVFAATQAIDVPVFAPPALQGGETAPASITAEISAAWARSEPAPEGVAEAHSLPEAVDFPDTEAAPAEQPITEIESVEMEPADVVHPAELTEMDPGDVSPGDLSPAETPSEDIDDGIGGTAPISLAEVRALQEASLAQNLARSEEAVPLGASPRVPTAEFSIERHVGASVAAAAAAVATPVIASALEAPAAPVASAVAPSVPASAEANGSAPSVPASQETAGNVTVPVEMVQQIAQRVIAQVSEKIIREIAWDVIPELAQRLVQAEIERIKAESRKS